MASKAMITEKGVEAVEVELEDGIDATDRDYDQALESLMMKPEAVREVNSEVVSCDGQCRSYFDTESSTQNQTRRLLSRLPHASRVDLDRLQCNASCFCYKR